MLIQMGRKQKIHSYSHGEEVCVVTVCHRNSTSKLPGILEDTNCSGYSTSQHTRHSAFWVLFSTLSPCSRSTTCARPAWPLEQPAVYVCTSPSHVSRREAGVGWAPKVWRQITHAHLTAILCASKMADTSGSGPGWQQQNQGEQQQSQIPWASHAAVCTRCEERNTLPRLKMSFLYMNT